MSLIGKLRAARNAVKPLATKENTVNKTQIKILAATTKTVDTMGKTAFIAGALGALAGKAIGKATVTGAKAAGQGIAKGASVVACKAQQLAAKPTAVVHGTLESLTEQYEAKKDAAVQKIVGKGLVDVYTAHFTPLVDAVVTEFVDFMSHPVPLDGDGADLVLQISELRMKLFAFHVPCLLQGQVEAAAMANADMDKLDNLRNRIEEVIGAQPF